jgi:hypothetical protein
MSFTKLYPNPHPESCPWHGMAEQYGSPNIKWCEETLCQIISEPANTWSNIAFILLALFMFYQVRNEAKGPVKWFPWGMLIMGSGSFIYHMSNIYPTQILDFVGMFVYVFWLGIYNAVRLEWLKPQNMYKALVVSTIAATAVLHIMYITEIKIQLIVAFAVLFIIITEVLCFKRDRKAQNYRPFIIAIILIALAQASSLSDLARADFICDPHNHFFQGHALWHVLSGLGTYFAFIYYRQFNFEKSS